MDRAELIDRLIDLERPNTELDRELHAIFVKIPNGYVRSGSVGAYLCYRTERGQVIWVEAPPYTASLETIVKLVKQELPQYDYIVGETNGGLTVYAQLGPDVKAFAETTAIALCIALLKVTK